MRRITVFLLAMLMTCSLFISTSCKNDDKGEAFLLKYDTGVDENHNFDDTKFMYNLLDTTGADPGTLYVSKEADPEYGGYFYSYITGCATDRGAFGSSYPSDVSALAFKCFRSENLSTWEQCGAANGYSLIGRSSDWEYWGDHAWAPEVIYNAEDEQYPYYMYYSIPSKIRDAGRLASTPSASLSVRQHIGIARSATPVGPFYSLSDEETIDGVTQAVPYIDFKNAYGLDYDVGVIDVHPFIDPTTGEFYLYFKGELAEQGTIPKGIYGMKMKSFVEPDYSSVTFLARGGYTTVNCTESGKEAFLANSINYEGCESYDGGSDLIEAPYMWTRDGNYYLTFSFHGYDNQGYQVLQAVGDSALGGFRVLQYSEGNPILDGTNTQYVKGTGHHSFIDVEGDLFITYHKHPNIQSLGSGWARYLAADKVSFVTVNGQEIMTTSGPSMGLNWRGEALTDYINVAENARISVSSGSGAEYLTDGLLPMYGYVYDRFFVTDKEVTITLSFDEAVAVDTIMIHNSAVADSAFSKISEIKFKLAEQPTFLNDSFQYAVIKDLAFPSLYTKEDDTGYIVSCAPAVAAFDEIKVSEIRITIDRNDRLNPVNKYGEDSTELNLSEIVVLGRKAA